MSDPDGAHATQEDFVRALKAAQADKADAEFSSVEEPLPDGAARVYFDPPAE